MSTTRKRTWITNRQTKTAWVVDYRDSGGVRRQKTFALKKAADTFLSSVTWEIGEGIHVPASESVTVQKACELWIERVVRDGMERSTVLDYSQVARAHIVPLIGDLKLTSLTKVRAEMFRDELLDTRSPSRARRALLYLKMAINEAQRLGKVGKNVAKEVVIKGSGRHGKRVTILSKDELNDFLDASETLGARAQSLAYLAVMHGLRASELRGLPWRNVHLDKGHVHIGQRADLDCKIGPPKTKAAIRDIPLTPLTQEALSAWKAECGSEELVFPYKGRPYYYCDFIDEVFDPIMFAAGLTKIKDGELKHRYSLHPLRHTAASIWIEQGFSPKRVQYLMGHSSIQITFDYYGHLIDLQFSGPDLMRQLEQQVRRRPRPEPEVSLANATRALPDADGMVALLAQLG